MSKYKYSYNLAYAINNKDSYSEKHNAMKVKDVRRHKSDDRRWE